MDRSPVVRVSVGFNSAADSYSDTLPQNFAQQRSMSAMQRSRIISRIRFDQGFKKGFVSLRGMFLASSVWRMAPISSAFHRILLRTAVQGAGADFWPEPGFCRRWKW